MNKSQFISPLTAALSIKRNFHFLNVNNIILWLASTFAGSFSQNKDVGTKSGH